MSPTIVWKVTDVCHSEPTSAAIVSGCLSTNPPSFLENQKSKTLTPRCCNPRMTNCAFLDYTRAASNCNSYFSRRNGGRRRRDNQNQFPAKMHRNTKRQRGGTATTTGTASPLREASDWIAAVEADRVGEEQSATSSPAALQLWNITVRVCGKRSSDANDYDPPRQSLQQWLTSGKETANLQVMCEAARGRSFRLPGLLTPRAVRSPVHVKRQKDGDELCDIERLWVQKHQNVSGWYSGHFVDNVDVETGQLVPWNRAVMGRGLCQGYAFCTPTCAAFLENVKKWFKTTEWWERRTRSSDQSPHSKHSHQKRYVYDVQHWEKYTVEYEEDNKSLTTQYDELMLAENYLDTQIFDTATHECARCHTSSIREFYRATTDDFGVAHGESLCVVCYTQVVTSAPYLQACASFWRNKILSVGQNRVEVAKPLKDDSDEPFVRLDDRWMSITAVDRYNGPDKCQAVYAPECLGDAADGPELKQLAFSMLPQLSRCCVFCVMALDLDLRRQKAAVAEPELLPFLVRDVVPLVLLFVSEPYVVVPSSS